MAASASAADVIGLDHTGIVVPDLEAAITFYERAFGARVVSRETDTDVDDVAIGLPGERVRLRGALLASGDTILELHEYLTPRGTGRRRACDAGLGHIAFAVTDIDAAWARLRDEGVVFNTEPRTITSGTLAGRRWVYGRDPWGVVIELCQHPTGTGPSHAHRHQGEPQ
jgi:catechol 2,3-dioxygenase-like lactoylglutathione lyase family enzyme